MKLVGSLLKCIALNSGRPRRVFENARQPKIQEIRVGGTKTKLVFTETASPARAVN